MSNFEALLWGNETNRWKVVHLIYWRVQCFLLIQTQLSIIMIFFLICYLSFLWQLLPIQWTFIGKAIMLTKNAEQASRKHSTCTRTQNIQYRPVKQGTVVVIAALSLHTQRQHKLLFAHTQPLCSLLINTWPCFTTRKWFC